MTPEQTTYFRDFIRLYDFSGIEDADAVFDGLKQIVIWTFRQEKEKTAQHDELFEGSVRGNSSLIGLLTYLATLDGRFFDLIKRMCARSLRSGNAPPFVQMISSGLIVSEPPSEPSPKLARNVAIILAISVGFDLGWHPTENIKKNDGPPRSACGRLAEGTSLTYSAVEKVWKSRRQNLEKAGFQGSDIECFLTGLDT